MAPPIRLFLADVDGTLVTNDKVLTDRAAVAKLGQARILFAVTSGRPPRGTSTLAEPLQLSTPIAAFNGGVYVRPDMSVVEQQVVPDDVTRTVIELLGTHGLDVWVYRRADWFLRDPKARHDYGDITNPNAKRAPWPRHLSRTYQIPPEQTATIGGQPDDVLMTAHSGLSIAMGNASHEVQAAARSVTTSNQDEGFANAIERFILP